MGALLPALPLYAQSIGLSGSASGIVLSAPALAMLALNLPAGKLVDSWGRKQMMVAGMFVIALSDLATSQCRTALALIPARLSLGAGRAAAENGDRAYLADLTERFPAARGTITGTQQAVQALGLVIGPLIGGRAAEAYGAPSVFFLISGAALACTGGYSLLPEINAAAEKEEEWARMSVDMSAEEEEEFEREREAIKAASDWRELLKSNRQRVITAAAGANALGFVAKLTCIPWFATGVLDATPAQVGELFSITALLGMASAPVGGVIADKVGLKAVVVASLANVRARTRVRAGRRGRASAAAVHRIVGDGNRGGGSRGERAGAGVRAQGWRGRGAHASEDSGRPRVPRGAGGVGSDGRHVGIAGVESRARRGVGGGVGIGGARVLGTDRRGRD